MKVRYLGSEPYVGADQHANASLSCSKGEVAEVSPQKAKELLATKDWELADPEAAKPRPSEPVNISGPSPTKEK